MKKFLLRINENIKLLSTSIYTGKKLEANLNGIFWASLAICLVTSVTTTMNFLQHKILMGISTLSIFSCAIISAIFVRCFKNRKVAVVSIWITLAINITLYAIYGSNEGFAILWMLLFPVFYMYFLDVKLGIFLSAYCEILIIILFYTPISEIMSNYYTNTFIMRFPVLYLCFFLLGTIQMVQYHVISLKQQEYEKNLENDISVEREKSMKMVLEKQIEDAEQQTKLEYISNVSHEIKTPINTIIGMNELIRKESQDEKILEYAKNADYASKELMAYIESILEMSGRNLNMKTYEDNDDIIKNSNINLHGMRILAVDDFETNLLIIKNYLKNANVLLDIAHGGAEALKMTNMNHYDVILLDYMMPGIDGMKVAKTIKNDITNPNTDVWIVALTANPEKDVLLSGGFDEYVAKPIRYNTLINLLKKHEKNGMTIDEQQYNIEKDFISDNIIESENKSHLRFEIRPEDEGENVHNQKDNEHDGSGDAAKNADNTMEENDDGAEYKDIAKIDVEAAMQYMLDDVDMYKEMVNIYVNSVDENVEKMEEAIENAEYEKYKIIVHGLKNTSNTIGAVKFSELSKKHEYAVKDNDIAYILSNYRAYISSYWDVASELIDAISYKL